MFTEELVREHTYVPRIVEEAEGEKRSMTLPSADPPGEAGRAMTHSDFGYLSSQAAAVTPRVNDEPLVSDLVPQALSWSSLNGLVIGDKNHKRSGTVPGIGLVHAPFSLLPSPFPRQAFSQAIELAPLFNLLADRVSQDAEFLQQTLARTRKADHFIARLLDIHLQMLDEGMKQKIRLGLHRSDYMLDTATGELLQVEINTIASSFPALGSLVASLHRHLIDWCGDGLGLEAENVPQNGAVDAFAQAFALAWKEYGDNRAVVLMVVCPEERNMYDQYWLALKLFQSYGIKMIRKSFTQVLAEGTLGDNNTLFIGKQVVSVVYYRAGYSPDDYPSESEWDARLLLERSAAVKCPNISYHLAGAKKIQQELAKPGVVERFFENKEDITKVRSCFAGLWGLDDENSAAIIEEAIRNPEGFVLKPQREGGGNNIYGADVSKKLVELRDTDGGVGLAAYILMQRIFPPVHPAYLVHDGIWSCEETVSELGIFSAYIRNGNKEVLNTEAGYLLRTKSSQTNEGGVAAGYAVLDSVHLI
ncbi:unnamed protein product [Sphagnum troendelagicum]|uniref:Glutathione synthetase n=1 Tax=Sphagnum troendelagicum TaxID=128251 RepID=A0ABP0U9V3_9BRYO